MGMEGRMKEGRRKDDEKRRKENPASYGEEGNDGKEKKKEKIMDA